MNDNEKSRILALVASGTLSAEQGARLLAALEGGSTPPDSTTSAKPEAPSSAKSEEQPTAAPKRATVEVQMVRPDGSRYNIEVPTNLAPMFWQMAKVAIRESARNAAHDISHGLRNMARRKAAEIRTDVENRFKHRPAEPPAEDPLQTQPARVEETRQRGRNLVLEMVRDGRLSVEDAGGILRGLEGMETRGAQSPAGTT